MSKIQLSFPLMLPMEVAVTRPYYFDSRGACLPEIRKNSEDGTPHLFSCNLTTLLCLLCFPL